MKQQLSNAFNSLWGGLVTGVIIGAVALVPTLASAQAEASVKASAQSQPKGETNKWADTTAVNPGASVRYIISYQNVGTAEQKNVMARVAMPSNVSYVPESATLYNAANSNGLKLPAQEITSEQGVLIGSYKAGANAYVTFEGTVAAADKLSCGDNQLKLSGWFKPESANKSDVSTTVSVKRDCATTPAQTTKPQPAAPAPVTPTPAAQTPVAAPAAPAAGSTALPNSGPSEVFAVFAIASVIGFIGHKLLVRRFLRG